MNDEIFKERMRNVKTTGYTLNSPIKEDTKLQKHVAELVKNFMNNNPSTLKIRGNPPSRKEPPPKKPLKWTEDADTYLVRNAKVNNIGRSEIPQCVSDHPHKT